MHFSTVKGRRELIILTIWIAYIILLLFCNKPAKKLCGICTLTAEPSPSSHACQYAFSWTILPPFKYVLYGWPHGATVWDNVVWDIVWDNCVWDNVWRLYIKRENLKFGHVILEPKWPNCAKNNFFRKTIDIIVMYLLTLLIVQSLKKNC